MTKDLFSGHASDYSRYRPSYKKELFIYLSGLCKEKKVSWDVGTGNGQAAILLADFFEKVIATDLSEKQISEAPKSENIEFRVARAEKSGISSHYIDLITVAQAFHWFDHPHFYEEVKRVSKPGSILAIWCYGNSTIDPKIDRIVFHLYEKILGDYWDKERKLVETGYKTIAVPFEEIKAENFSMQSQWNMEQLLGYIGTWSALQKYKNKVGLDPRLEISQELERAWGRDESKIITWPLSLRVFRV